jgi:uncharacterized repeat protein (TIGR01451 family)
MTRKQTATFTTLTVVVLAVTGLGSPAEAKKPQPVIAGFTPGSGPVGTSVTITGTDFRGTKAVTFDGTRASFVTDSRTEITATVPAGAATGPIRVLHGSGGAVSAADFTIQTGTPTADLTLRILESSDPVVADSALEYTIELTNAGPDAALSTSLTDTIPPDVIFSSASDGGVFDARSGTVTWDLGIVDPGTVVGRHVWIKPIHPVFPMTDSASVTTTSEDPGMPDDVTTDTTVEPQPGTHYVSVRDSGSVPFYRGLALGETLQWDFFGPSAHEITDSHGLGYLDTGLRSPVSYSTFTFNQSAEIRTKDLDAYPMNVGKITVPVQVSPASGTTTSSFLVVWALAAPPPGIVEDVQVKSPGGTWVHWQHGQTVALQAPFVPDAGPGTYSFRSRIRNVGNDAVSRFGPPVTVAVS